MTRSPRRRLAPSVRCAALLGAALLAVGLGAACASTTAAGAAAYDCRAGEDRALMDSLYFGTITPEGRVSPDDWQRFLADEITPRFPGGLTSWAAAGQWRNGSGALEKESSYVLHVVHSDTPETDSAILDVIRIYKERFRQEAVLRVRSPACISF
jgi:hypothetical protein